MLAVQDKRYFTENTTLLSFGTKQALNLTRNPAIVAVFLKP